MLWNIKLLALLNTSRTSTSPALLEVTECMLMFDKGESMISDSILMHSDVMLGDLKNPLLFFLPKDCFFQCKEKTRHPFQKV